MHINLLYAATSPPPVSTIVVSITSSGINMAGENYKLECTTTVTGTTEEPVITWMNSMGNITTPRVVATGNMSTLTFIPLAASHAGMYTCQATLGSAMDSAYWTITVRSE